MPQCQILSTIETQKINLLKFSMFVVKYNKLKRHASIVLITYKISDEPQYGVGR